MERVRWAQVESFTLKTPSKTRCISKETRVGTRQRQLGRRGRVGKMRERTCLLAWIEWHIDKDAKDEDPLDPAEVALLLHKCKTYILIVVRQVSGP